MQQQNENNFNPIKAGGGRSAPPPKRYRLLLLNACIYCIKVSWLFLNIKKKQKLWGKKSVQIFNPSPPSLIKNEVIENQSASLSSKIRFLERRKHKSVQYKISVLPNFEISNLIELLRFWPKPHFYRGPSSE